MNTSRIFKLWKLISSFLEWSYWSLRILGIKSERKDVSPVNEALRIAAWLRANAKHMGNPFEVDQMLRASVIMKLLADELTRRDAISERVQRH